ncbi:GINS complex, Psf1 component [Rozella allomycis CSF55]|uniref:DNA replication complex GINS protein PSF1 n=1 Tax=Rozella allomycis (strain CSF55) TaxID=988480 RepID=A0A4P9YPE3_ROZAC|nr:GINS complex, Psf1 component [Rozella allomycis CSF55]
MQASSLVKEIKRNKGAIYSPYNELAVRQQLQEISAHYSSAQDIANTDTFSKHIDIYKSLIERGKQSLILYHEHRLQMLQSLFWQGGSRAVNQVMQQSNTHESNFLQSYSNLMAKMISKYKFLDIRASLVPPKDLFIQIRVLKDCGNLLTTSGVITLEKDSQHFVRRTDVEHLISQGHVIHVI